MKRRSKIGLGVAGAAAVALVATALRPAPVPVESAAVVRGPFAVHVEEDGRTRVTDRYVVFAPIAGSLERIALEAGDEVREGQVVARIAPAPAPLLDARTRAEAQARLEAARAAVRRAEAAVRRAEAERQFAAAELGRARSLAEAGGVSARDLENATLGDESAARELDSARFAASVARFEERMARATLAGGAAGGEVLELRAPAAGRVLRVERESAGFVAPGTPLLEIGDPASLEVVADLLTVDAVEVRPGARVELRRWGGPTPLHGRVRRVQPSAFTKVSALGVEEQRVDVVIDLVEPPEARPGLGDGFAVDVAVEVYAAEDAVLAPAGALFRQGDGWATYAIEDGVARLRRLVAGRRNGLEVQVLEGLSPGEVVVVHPPDRVGEGTPVRGR
jgi:HlyD family secretion protein